MNIYKILTLIILFGVYFNLSVSANEIAPEVVIEEDTSSSFNNTLEIITPSIEDAIQSISSEGNKTIEGSVTQAPSINLDECIKIALANNPQIQSAIYNKEIYKTKIGQAWANYFPEFSASIGYDRTKNLMPALSSIKMQPYNFINTVSVSATQLVYDFGKTRTSANMAKRTYEATAKNLDETINTIVYQVKEAYFNLLYAIQQENILKESVKIYESHLAQAKSYYDIGVKAKIDVITAEHNLSSVKLSHIKAKNAIDVAYANLNNALGIPNKEPYKISDNLASSYYEVNFDNLLNDAYQSRPALLSAQKKAEASKYLVKASKVAFLPDVKLAASYNLGGREFNADYGYTFGGSLSYELVNLMKLKKQVDEAKATYKKDESDYEVQKQSVYLEVKQAYISLIELEDSIPVSKMALSQAKEQYDLADGRYKVGLGDAIEFKDAENTYRNAQLDYYKTLLDYNIAAANLEKVVGVPLKEAKAPLL